MKLLKFGLRFWVTLGSVFSFLVGWAMLGHAPKPAQPQQAQSTVTTIDPAPTLAPLPPLNFSGNNTTNNTNPFSQLFSVQPQPSFQRSRPLFSTGGS